MKPVQHLPKMIRIKQSFKEQRVGNISERLSQQIHAKAEHLDIKPGQRVAIACSSRGLTDYPVIVNTLVTTLKDLGLSPFLVPAMGSHGAGTAEGQEKVLHHLGLTPDVVGAPIRSCLDVVDIGRTPEDVPVVVDRLAHEADHIVIVNRIKKHTDFMGQFESGLMKMMAIGLGKIAGAEIYHQAMMTYGSSHMIGAIARTVLNQCNILLGVATIEDGYTNVADIGVFHSQEIEASEQEFFQRSKALSPSLPFDEADVLLIDEIGKEISGAGFDTRVVGRIGLLGTPEPEKPDIKRLILSDLTAASEGNGCGIGLADIITRRLADKIDQECTDTNTIISMALEMGRTPLIVDNDIEALRLAIRSVGLIPPEQIKLIRIKNTLYLSEIDVSQAFLPALADRPDLTITDPEHPMAFDSSGYLKPFNL